MPIILGIDPGSCITGFGVIEAACSGFGKHKHIASGSIRVIKSSFSDQLQQIFIELSKVIKLHVPDEAAIEQVFVHANANSALKLGQARGAAIVAASCGCAKVFEYSARQVKQAVVGYGSAAKDQVQHMVKLLLNLQELPQADAADALAIAICHANSRKGFNV